MSGERSRRTLAECERPSKRVEVDRESRLAAERSWAGSSEAQEMGARRLAVGRHVFPNAARGGRGLVEGKQPAPAPDVFPHFRAIHRKRPGFDARRTNASN